MAEQQEMVEDTQVIFDGSTEINQKELRNLSKYAENQIERLARFLICTNDVNDTKAELHFWEEVLRCKNSYLNQFTGNGFDTKTLSVIEHNGVYVTFFNDDSRSHRFSTPADIVMSLALKVMDKQIDFKKAIAKYKQIDFKEEKEHYFEEF